MLERFIKKKAQACFVMGRTAARSVAFSEREQRVGRGNRSETRML